VPGRDAPYSAGYSKTFYTLAKNTSAIQIIPDGNGRIRLGTLLQLPEGAQVEVNGEGFDDKTSRVTWEGASYYIFLNDVQTARAQRMSAAAAG